MSRRDARLFLAEMIEACGKVAAYTRDLDEPAFRRNTLVQDAVIRNLEIIGEAARQLPDVLQAQHPGIPWKRVIGFRHLAIHAYFAVDWSVVWRIATDNLPELEPQLRSVLDSLGGLPQQE